MRRILCWVMILASVASARAASLRPDELLLIYNADSPASRELATYYAKVRRVPAEQMVGLNLAETGEEISAADFERLIRLPVRAFLEERKLEDKVRCLATFFGVPIRVDKIAVSARQLQLRGQWQQEVAKLLEEWDQAIAELQGIATSQPAASRPVARGEQNTFLYSKRYNEARAAAL